MRYIVSTTGTSIARGVPPPADPRDRPRYAAAIRVRIEQFRTEDAANFHARVSAETNSLARLRITPADQLLMLHSDTADGEICATQLADLLRAEFGATVAVARVTGLQVTDAARFRTVGVPSLFRHLDRFAAAAGEGSELLLNITGGFKSVVPYVTLYGMLQRHRVVYLFEQSDELIALPPAPLDFDWDRLGRIAPALRALKQAGVMQEADFFALAPGVTGDEHNYFASLLEQDGGLVAPSALGEMVYAAIETAESARILLSKEAQATLRQSSGIEREQYRFILARIANPIQRQQHMHRIHGSDLLFWKPGRTKERAGYYLEGGGIHVCDLHPHEYSGRSKADFPSADFITYYPAAGEVPETEEAAMASWAKRLESAAVDLTQAREDRQAAEALLDEANRERADAGRELVESQAARDRMRLELGSSQAGLAAAEAKIARLERPWWRRLLSSR